MVGGEPCQKRLLDLLVQGSFFHLGYGGSRWALGAETQIDRVVEVSYNTLEDSYIRILSTTLHHLGVLD